MKSNMRSYDVRINSNSKTTKKEEVGNIQYQMVQKEMTMSSLYLPWKRMHLRTQICTLDFRLLKQNSTLLETDVVIESGLHKKHGSGEKDDSQ